LIQILGLLGMYFDAVVVEVKKNLLLFRLAMTILCQFIVRTKSSRGLGEFSKIHQHYGVQIILKLMFFPLDKRNTK
jgi:hypothetical protein